MSDRGLQSDDQFTSDSDNESHNLIITFALYFYLTFMGMGDGGLGRAMLTVCSFSAEP